MKNIKTVKILFTIPLLTLSSLLYAQNFWEQAQSNKSIVEVADTSCPVYNAEDIEIEYQHAIGGEGNNGAIDIDFSPDSNFIMLYGNQGTYFALFDEAGNELWSKTLMVNADTMFGATQFIRIGYDYYISGYWGDYYTRKFGIMKTNEYGEKLWLKKIYEEPPEGTKMLEYRNPTIINVEDNNFLVSVELRNDLLVAKFDSSCNKLWELSKNDLGYEGRNVYFELLFNFEKYLIYLDLFYAFVNKEGKIINTGLFSSGNHNQIYHQNNKFYACGYENPEQWIRKYSLDFELEKEYRITQLEYQWHISQATTIKELSDGSILAFYDYSYMGSQEYQDDYNINLLHLDKNLSCKSIINLYAAGSQYSNKLLVTKNEDYILFGSGYYAYNERDMVFLARLNGWPVSINENIKKNKTKVFPNPAFNELHLSFNGLYTGEICIYNLLGKQIRTISIRSKKIKLDISELSKGMYLLMFENDQNYLHSIKIIKN